VFTSVTGLSTVSVSAEAPLAYDPPMIVTFAVVFVSDSSWNSGPVAGKLAPAATDSAVPLTEMTADVGAAAGGVFVPEPEPLAGGAAGVVAVCFGLLDLVLLDFCGDANGSLLENSLKDSS
jgi:hypothetical protein